MAAQQLSAGRRHGVAVCLDFCGWQGHLAPAPGPGGPHPVDLPARRVSPAVRFADLPVALW